MAIVKQLDKRSGLTYVYESKSYWDKEKKQARSHRTLIGRLDPETGKVVPTDGRGKRRGMGTKSAESKVPKKRGPTPAVRTQRLFYGATYLLDRIGEKLGITGDLRTCFPDTYKQILSLVYYLILAEGMPLYRFRTWGLLHMHPYGEDIPSQRSSEIFQGITEEQKQHFFRLQGKRRLDKEFWAYDTTSISSYSEILKLVKYGKNKDDDRLPQINLALLFGQDSRLPFCYRELAGNIPDVKTLRETIDEITSLDCGKIKYCMDRGFCSADNINLMYKDHVKFLMSASSSLSYAKDFIKEVGNEKDSYEHYNGNFGVYTFTQTVWWDYEQKRPYKGDVLKGARRMYIHLYYNPEKYADDAVKFNQKLDRLKAEILSGHRVADHERLYKKYFIINETPVRGISLAYKQDAINSARERYGFFVLISNEVKDPAEALRLYRLRDVVEKAFGDLKDRLNCRRSLVSSESSLRGKLFVEFVALIYLSYVKKMMEDKGLFSKYTMPELFDELELIECHKEPGKAVRYGEVLSKQEQIYRDLEVEPLLAKPEAIVK